MSYRPVITQGFGDAEQLAAYLFQELLRISEDLEHLEADTGPWTPQIVGGTSGTSLAEEGTTFTDLLGYYRKVGDRVEVWFSFHIDTLVKGSVGDSESLAIAGFPFEIDQERNWVATSALGAQKDFSTSVPTFADLFYNDSISRTVALLRYPPSPGSGGNYNSRTIGDLGNGSRALGMYFSYLTPEGG